MEKCIWISWEVHRRNRGISDALSCPLHEITYNKQRFSRYLQSSLKTLRYIRQHKFQYVIAQNPSILLALLTVSLRKWFRYKSIIDSHNSGLFPMEGQSRFLMALSKWLQRNADITVVTNPNLKRVVESNGGKGFVLFDKVPDAPQTKAFRLEGKYNIACISTFNRDEPYQQIIDAAHLIPDDMYIYFTGKYQAKINRGSTPPNVKLLGFVPEDEYWSLLDSADVIIDLTLRDDCLVCGAYEGIAVGKPLILSKTVAIMNYFNRGCVYVDSEKCSIASGILEAFKQIDLLKRDIVRLRDLLKEDWEKRIKLFVETLNTL